MTTRMQTGRQLPWEVVLLSVASGIISLYLSGAMLGWMPHIPDEISYAFQGKILASGHLWIATPPVPPAFSMDHILFTHGRWCSVYPPGWPLLLAIGWLIRAPWIITPILLTLSVLGVWRLALQLFDRNTAFLAVALFCISPFVILMSAGFMSHQATLCASVWCLVLLTHPATSRNAIGAGLLAGYAFLVRPYTAILLLTPAFLWIILERRKDFKSLLMLAAAILPALVCFLAYNRLLFGSFYRAGYALDPLWEFKGPETLLFFSKLQWFVKNINDSLWGLPFPDPFILLPLLLPQGRSRYELMLLICCASLVLGYSFYYYSDIVYSGPRFAYEMMGFVSILAARAMIRIATLLKNAVKPLKFLALACGCFLIIFPIAIRLPQQVEYHSHLYHGQSHRLVGKADTCGIGQNALVLIAGNYYVLGSFFFQNALQPQNGPRVFARDVTSVERDIIQAYPRKELWRLWIELTALPGSNPYSDRWNLSRFSCERLNDKIAK